MAATPVLLVLATVALFVYLHGRHLDAMLRAGTETATVLDDDGRPAGTISWSTIVREAPPKGGGR
jgi:hypothetical protein